jgi:hypothetical protein
MYAAVSRIKDNEKRGYNYLPSYEDQRQAKGEARPRHTRDFGLTAHEESLKTRAKKRMAELEAKQNRPYIEQRELDTLRTDRGLCCDDALHLSCNAVSPAVAPFHLSRNTVSPQLKRRSTSAATRFHPQL